MKYILITPVKNEFLYFKETLESVCNQNIKPEKWIIIDDESTDGTSELIAKYATKYNYIEHHKMINFRPDLSSTGGRSGALMNYARSLIYEDDIDYIVKIDADISFAPDFFEKLFFEFEKNPKLGIASGHLVQDGSPERIFNWNTTRGATRIYKKECFNKIGKYETRRGEDEMDTYKVRYLGWETRTFDVYFNHLKPEGARNNFIKNNFETGQYKGWIPYNLFYFTGTLIKNMKKKPFILASIIQFFGYIYSRYVTHKRPFNKEVCKFVRLNQVKTMMKMLSSLRLKKSL